jgi:hypothetical protein
MFGYEDQTRSRVEGAIREGLRSQYAQRGLKGDRKPGSKVIPVAIFLAIVAVIILGACAGKTNPRVPTAPTTASVFALPSDVGITLAAQRSPVTAGVLEIAFRSDSGELILVGTWPRSTV